MNAKVVSVSNPNPPVSDPEVDALKYALHPTPAPKVSAPSPSNDANAFALIVGRFMADASSENLASLVQAAVSFQNSKANPSPTVPPVPAVPTFDIDKAATHAENAMKNGAANAGLISLYRENLNGQDTTVCEFLSFSHKGLKSLRFTAPATDSEMDTLASKIGFRFVEETEENSGRLYARA